jgi:hypothetical protein
MTTNAVKIISLNLLEARCFDNNLELKRLCYGSIAEIIILVKRTISVAEIIWVVFKVLPQKIAAPDLLRIQNLHKNKDGIPLRTVFQSG